MSWVIFLLKKSSSWFCYNWTRFRKWVLYHFVWSPALDVSTVNQSGSTLIGFPTWQTLSGNGPCPAGRQAPPELHRDHFWKKSQDPVKLTYWTPKWTWLDDDCPFQLEASLLIFRGVSSHKRSNSGEKTTTSIQKPSHRLDFWQFCLQVIQNTAPIFFVFNPSFTPQKRTSNTPCEMSVLSTDANLGDIQKSWWYFAGKNEWIWIQICWVCVFLGHTFPMVHPEKVTVAA